MTTTNQNQLIDLADQEFQKLSQAHNQVSNAGQIRVDHNELDNVVRKFEQNLEQEKVRVDSHLLHLTSVFTNLVHEARNKSFAHLEEQNRVFHDNASFLRSSSFNNLVTNIHTLPLPVFNKDDFKHQVVLAQENQKDKLIQDKLNEIYACKRSVESSHRALEFQRNLIQKLRDAPNKLQTKNDDSFKTLQTSLEGGLKKAIQAYQPKPIKPFARKTQTGSHLDVQTKDYFNAGVVPTIHFFEPETKNLHIYTLPTAYHWDEKVKPEKVQLETEFNIPAYHGSIVNPEGRIFLIGGMGQGKNGSKRTYEYNPKDRHLTRKADLNADRFGFALCHAKGKIFVVGGINATGILGDAECYDIATNTWSTIAAPKIPTAHANLSNYKDQYLFKFGGYGADQKPSNGVERYDLQTGQWTVVSQHQNVGNTVPINPLAASCQINAHQVLVFGGVGADKRGSKDSFTFNVDEVRQGDQSLNLVITNVGDANLPTGDGFWSPQAFVQSNRVWTIQNVTDHNGHVSGRRVLVFGNRKWEVASA